MVRVIFGIVELKDLKQSWLISLGRNFDCCPARLGDLVTPAYGYPSRDTRVLQLINFHKLTGYDLRELTHWLTGDNLQCRLTVADVI